MVIDTCESSNEAHGEIPEVGLVKNKIEDFM